MADAAQIRAGEAFVEIFLRDAQLKADLVKASALLKTWVTSVNAASSGIMGPAFARLGADFAWLGPRIKASSRAAFSEIKDALFILGASAVVAFGQISTAWAAAWAKNKAALAGLLSGSGGITGLLGGGAAGGGDGFFGAMMAGQRVAFIRIREAAQGLFGSMIAGAAQLGTGIGAAFLPAEVAIKQIASSMPAVLGGSISQVSNFALIRLATFEEMWNAAFARMNARARLLLSGGTGGAAGTATSGPRLLGDADLIGEWREVGRMESAVRAAAGGIAASSRTIGQSLGIAAGGVGRAFQTMVMGTSLAAVKISGAVGLLIKPWLEIGRAMGGVASAYVRSLGAMFSATMKLITGLFPLLPSLFQSTGRALQRIGQQLASMGTQLMFVGGLMLAPIVAAVRGYVTAGTELERLSAKTGDTVENLSALAYAARISNVDVGTLTHSLSLMQRFLSTGEGIGVAVPAGKGGKASRGGKGTREGKFRVPDSEGGTEEAGGEPGIKTQQETLKQLGLTLDDLRGKLPTEQFLMLAEAISHVEDPAQRAAFAMKMFGVFGGGSDILPLIEMGRKRIEAQMAIGKAMGFTWTTQEAAGAKALRDDFVRLTFAFQEAGRVIGAAFTPMLITMTERVTDFVVASARWITQHKDFIYLWVIGAAKISAFGIALFAVGKAFQVVATPLRLIGSVLSMVFSGVSLLLPILSVMANPVILFTAALVGAVAYMAYATGFFGTAVKWIGERFMDLKNYLSEIWSGMAGALAAGDLATAFKILTTAGKIVWLEMTMAMDKAWRTLFFNAIGIVMSGIVAWKAIFTSFAAWVGDLWRGLQNTISPVFLKLFLKNDLDAEINKANALLRAETLLKNGASQADIHSFLQGSGQDIRGDITQEKLNGALQDQGQRVTDARKAYEGGGQALADKNANKDQDIADAKLVAALNALQAEQDKINADMKNAIGPSKEDLAKLAGLQDELRSLITKGKSEKPLTFPGWSPPPSGAGIAAAAKEAAGVGPRGTFSAIEANRLGAGAAKSPMEAHMERTAKATEETAKNTRTLPTRTGDKGVGTILTPDTEKDPSYPRIPGLHDMPAQTFPPAFGI